MPQFFRPHISSVVAAMLTIAGTNMLSLNIRQLAIEFLVTLAEGASGMVRKIPDAQFTNMVCAY